MTPPSTKNRDPIIIYLPYEAKHALAARSAQEDRSVSRIAADLIVGQLTKEEALALWIRAHGGKDHSISGELDLERAMAKIGPIAGRYSTT